MTHTMPQCCRLPPHNSARLWAATQPVATDTHTHTNTVGPAGRCHADVDGLVGRWHATPSCCGICRCTRRSSGRVRMHRAPRRCQSNEVHHNSPPQPHMRNQHTMVMRDAVFVPVAPGWAAPMRAACLAGSTCAGAASNATPQPPRPSLAGQFVLAGGGAWWSGQALGGGVVIVEVVHHS